MLTVGLLCALIGCNRQVGGSNVVLTEWAGSPLLLVDGQPFSIRGVTFTVPAGGRAELQAAFQDLAALNVNAIRIWAVDDDTPAVLDLAARHGIRVMVGLWLRHGQPGPQGNDRFDWLADVDGRRAQWDAALDAVRRFRHHPAVLMWALGNEVIDNIAAEEERIAFAEFLGRLATEVKKLDPRHPVTSAGSSSVPWPYWREHCGALDLFGVNVYGPVINDVVERHRELGLRSPLIVTEFGATGIWDVAPDANGARLQVPDAVRYRTIADGWNDWVLPATKNLGGFVFHYADTPVSEGNWWSTRVDGHTRPSYWAIREAFAGKPPADHLPTILHFATRRRMVKAATWLPLDLQVTDPEGGAVDLEFLAQPEGTAVAPSALQSRGALDTGGIEVRAPTTPGVWIFSVLARDPFRNLALAQTSVIVADEIPETGAGEPLPFYVFRDDASDSNHFSPTGHMGDARANVDFGQQADGQQGTSIRVRLDPGGGWYGLAWLDPPFDWGRERGGFDLSGATTLSWLARGEDGDETVTFAFGILGADVKWPDTAGAELRDVRLTRAWRRYSIPLAGRDLTRIKTGFALFARNRERGLTIFVDDIGYH